MKILLGVLIAALVGVLIGVRRGGPRWPALAVVSIAGSVVCFVAATAPRAQSSCGDSICLPDGGDLLRVAGIVVGGGVAAACAVAALIGVLKALDGRLRAVGVVPAIVFATLLGAPIAHAVRNDLARRHAERVARSFFEAARDRDARRACELAADYVRNDGVLRPCGTVVGAIQSSIPPQLSVVATSRLGDTWVIYFEEGSPTVVAYVRDGKVELASAG